MNPLFPSDWRVQVRELLAPFEKEPTCDEERRGEWLCYRVETRELVEPRREDTHGVFLLGEVVLNYHSLYEGESGTSDLVWASKEDFVSPLHFWVAAITLQRSSESGFSDPWFDYRIDPKAEFFVPENAFALANQVMHYHRPQKTIPGVPIWMKPLCGDGN